MLLLCLGLSVGLVMSLTALFLLKRDIKKLKSQVIYKNQTGSHFEIISFTGNKEIELLCKEINNIYDKIFINNKYILKKEREMQTLILGMSHDMRTPMTSMQGYLDLLKDVESKDERLDYIEIISFRLKSLKDMLEDLFTYAKLNNREFLVKLNEILIYPLLCKGLFSYYYDFEKKGIEPRIIFEDEQMIVNGNEELLNRIFQNLISNVLRHGNHDFSIKQVNNQIIFSNSINDRNLEIDKIFDRFYKGKTSKYHTSSGLGLANVKEMVEKMGWNVTAYFEDNILSIVLTVQ